MIVRLMNGKEVAITQEETARFITEEPACAVDYRVNNLPLLVNPYWLWSGQLSQGEADRYVAGDSTPALLDKIARYLLVYAEQTAHTAFMFDKAEGNLPGTGEFNLPVVEKLRELRKTKPITRDTIFEMERLMTDLGLGGL